MIKTIIFDIGGVIHEPFGKELLDNASKKLGITLKELRNLMDRYEPDLQVGKIDHITFWKKIIKEKDKSVPESTLKRLWIDPFKKKAKIEHDVVRLLKKLKSQYVLGCISNTQEPHITYNRKRGLFKLFDICLLSSKIRIRKPDKKIFRAYLKKAKCKPSEAIFIDDEKKHLKPAKELGISVIHFKNSEQLKKKLASFGVEI